MGIELFATGEIYWCKAHQPDDKYGKYGVDIIITPEEAAVLNAKIAEVLQAKKIAIMTATKLDPDTIKVAVNTIKLALDKDKKPIEGKYAVKTKKNGYNKDKTLRDPIPVFDAEKKVITSLVGNGSKGKLKFTFNVCDMLDEQFGDTKVYASLRPVALMVTELKEYKKPVAKIDALAGF